MAHLQVPQAPPGPSLRASVSCPNMNTKSLQHLLAAHHLPAWDDLQPQGPSSPSFDYSAYPESLPPCVLRYAPAMVERLHQRLAEVSTMFAPTQPPSLFNPCASSEDTKRFKDRLVELAQRSRLAATARHRSDMTHAEYLVKYLFRPLNEMLRCMLLATGLQLYWRLGTSHPTRAELVYARAEGSPEVIALVAMMAPADLPDSSMRMMTDWLRTEVMKVDENGQVVISSPLPPNHRNKLCQVVGKMLDAMLEIDVNIAVLTNCNRFMVVNSATPMQNGDGVLEFSPLVKGCDTPCDLMTDSPLGLLLGVTVFAAHRRGLSLRVSFQRLERATTTSVMSNLLAEHFGTIAKRRSLDLRVKRRAIFEAGVFPSQLGRGTVTFKLPLKLELQDTFSTETRDFLSSMVNPFYGPTTFPHAVPHLLPEATNDAWFTPEICLHQFYGRGDLWNVFSAQFAWLPTTQANLIVKFCNLTSFPEEMTEAHIYSRAVAHRAIRAEVRLYTGRLLKLQGIAIPRFLGLMGSRQWGNKQCWAALYEDAGVSLTPGDGVHPGTRAEIRKIYQQLHECGVLHGDVAWRHILRSRSDGRLRVISFDRAQPRKNESDREWALRCDEEMVHLDKLLGEGQWSPAHPDEPETDSDLTLPILPFAAPQIKISVKQQACDGHSRFATPKTSFDLGSRGSSKVCTPEGTPKKAIPMRGTPRTPQKGRSVTTDSPGRLSIFGTPKTRAPGPRSPAPRFPTPMRPATPTAVSISITTPAGTPQHSGQKDDSGSSHTPTKTLLHRASWFFRRS